MRPQELEQSLTELFPRLVGYLSTIVGGEAEDVAQETCMRLLEKYESLRVGGIGGLAFKIAHDLGVNHLRARARRSESALSSDIIPPMKGGTPLDDVSTKELQALLMDEFLKLPAEQQSSLYLREREAMSYKDIADQLGASLAQVKVWIYRGRAVLAERIEAMGLSGGGLS